MGRLNPPSPLRIAIDAMFFNSIEHDIGRIADRFRELPAGGFAVFRRHLGRIVFQTGNDLPAIAPRRAPADRLRLQQNDGCAGFGRIQSRRTAGNAAADHGKVDTSVARERLGNEGRFAHCRRPERAIMACGGRAHRNRHSAAILGRGPACGAISRDNPVGLILAQTFGGTLRGIAEAPPPPTARVTISPGPAASSEAKAPLSGLAGVLGTLMTSTLLPSTATRSVNVPPTSIPTRIGTLVYVPFVNVTSDTLQPH